MFDHTVSLLQPPGTFSENTTTAIIDPDLNLESLVNAFGVGPRHLPFIRQILVSLNTNSEVIAWRQAVLHDFVQNPALVERVRTLLPRLADLKMGHELLGKYQRSVLFETADRLAELDLYQGVVQEVYDALNTADLHSEALVLLRQQLLAIINDDNFQRLRVQLPELQRPLQNIHSLTIGVNLDSQLQPRSAVLLSINERLFVGSTSLLDRLFGTRDTDTEKAGLAMLHTTPEDPDLRQLSPLFQDLERLITQVAQPIARALGRYIRINTALLRGMESELVFYTAAIELFRRLEGHGITFCQPLIAPRDERITQIEGLINFNLALRETPTIVNDVMLDDQGRIGVLTGPNSGGKTTYLQAIGLAHVLFQAGLLIPAHFARMSPVDGIFTHFPALESQHGRLAEEAVRLRQICLNTTEYSLVLLNESLSSTTSSEALYLAQDLLAGLRAIGVRAMYATHLIELAERLPEVQALVDGQSTIFSLVAGIQFVLDESSGQTRAIPTFKITRDIPQGRGYAQEIARRYGISLQQILQARQTDTAHNAS